jgi:hypothetical protein
MNISDPPCHDFSLFRGETERKSDRGERQREREIEGRDREIEI